MNSVEQARQLPEKIVKRYKAAKDEVDPAKLATSSLISIGSFALMPEMQTAFAYLAHELTKEKSTEDIGRFILPMILLTTAISLTVETQALDKERYSAANSSTVMLAVTHRALRAALIGQGIAFGLTYLANPYTFLHLKQIFTGEAERTFYEGAIGSAVALTLWNVSMNTLILAGLAEPAVKGVRHTGNKIGGLTKGVNSKFENKLVKSMVRG